jgi:RNase adaptor protein for sRNA GlmZ degradation
MKRIFITGMSGTGKSSVIEVLKNRGFVAIDTDYDDWCEQTLMPNSGEVDWILRRERLEKLLKEPLISPLFVAGCRSNQRDFYHFFDYKVLFSAPLDVMLDRVTSRISNPYGHSEEERAEITNNFQQIQPLLKKSADIEIDTAVMSVKQIADFLVDLSFNSVGTAFK